MSNNEFNLFSSLSSWIGAQDLIQGCQAWKKQGPKEAVLPFALGALKISSLLFGLYGAYYAVRGKPVFLNQEHAKNFADLRQGSLDPEAAKKTAQESLSFGNDQFRKLANICMLSDEERAECKGISKQFTDHLYSGEYKNRKAWPLTATHLIEDCLGNSSSFCSSMGQQIVAQSFRTRDKSYPEELIRSCQKSSKNSQTCKDIFKATVEQYIKNNRLSDVGKFTSSCSRKIDKYSEFIMSDAMETVLANRNWKTIGMISKNCERNVHTDLCQNFIAQANEAYETAVKNSSKETANEELSVYVNKYVESCFNQEKESVICKESLSLLNEDDSLEKTILLLKSNTSMKQLYLKQVMPKALQSYNFLKLQLLIAAFINDEKQLNNSSIQEIVTQYKNEEKFDHMIAVSETILKQQSSQYKDIVKQTFEALYEKKRYADCYALAQSCLTKNVDFCLSEVEVFIDRLFDSEFESQENWEAWRDTIHANNPFNLNKKTIKSYYPADYTIPSSERMRLDLMTIWAHNNGIYDTWRFHGAEKERWRTKVGLKNNQDNNKNNDREWNLWE